MKSHEWYVPALQATFLACVISVVVIEQTVVIVSAILCVVACLIMAAALAFERRSSSRQILTACLLPAALFVGLTCSHLPLKLAFASQRGAFDRAADAILAGEPPELARWYGPFRIVAWGDRAGTPYLVLRGEDGNPEVFAREPEGRGFNIWSIIHIDGQWSFVSED